MNYYPFHIGDYASATRHLTWDEDMAYRRLIDAYYTRETPIPTDMRQVYRLVLATTEEQRLAVDTILNEFFTYSDDGWINSRCDAEIEAFRIKSAKASQSAQARWRNANGKPTDSERNANASVTTCERIETEYEGNAPKTNTKTNISTTDVVDKRKSATAARPDYVSQSVWDDFLAIRKAKKSPLSPTALHGIEREAAKAGLSLEAALSMCCSRGWQSFKADWVKEDGKAGQKQTTRNGAAMASYGTIFPTTQEGQGNGRTIDATPRLG